MKKIKKKLIFVKTANKIKPIFKNPLYNKGLPNDLN
jgi:hypothetical protein